MAIEEMPARTTNDRLNRNRPKPFAGPPYSDGFDVAQSASRSSDLSPTQRCLDYRPCDRWQWPDELQSDVCLRMAADHFGDYRIQRRIVSISSRQADF